MAEQPPPPAKGKGSGLSAKKGPLPLWAWLLIGVALLYLAYRYFSNSGSLLSSPAASTTSSTAPTDTSSDEDGSLGLAPSAGSPSDTGQTTSDLVSALGGQQASLLTELEAQNQDVLGLAASQIAALQTTTTNGAVNTQTQPVSSTQPGGSIAPIIEYVSPSVVTGTGASASPPAAAKPVVAPVSATHYYTYKANVPLGPNQTVHFATGKGYYAS